MFFQTRQHKTAAKHVFLWALGCSKARFPQVFDGKSVDETQRLARFEIIAFYMAFALWQLGYCAPKHHHRVYRYAQEEMFRQFDASLREQGMGDVKVAHYIRKLASAFFGRLQSYHQALNQHDKHMLLAAMARNQCAPETEREQMAEDMLNLQLQVQQTRVPLWEEKGCGCGENSKTR